MTLNYLSSKNHFTFKGHIIRCLFSWAEYKVMLRITKASFIEVLFKIDLHFGCCKLFLYLLI